MGSFRTERVGCIDQNKLIFISRGTCTKSCTLTLYAFCHKALSCDLCEALRFGMGYMFFDSILEVKMMVFCLEVTGKWSTLWQPRFIIKIIHSLSGDETDHFLNYLSN